MADVRKTTAAFNELISALEEIRDGYVLSEERFSADVDVLEGYRYVAQLLSVASELLVEGDPDHPRFASIVSPARKLQGDNPDAIYHYARIRGDLTYRVTGVIGEERYTSFTVHGQADDGGLAGPILADVNHHDFQVAEDGSYSVVFGPDKHEGDFVRLEPEAYSIIVRSYFQRETSVQNDPFVSVKLGIETLDDVPPPPPLDDETLAARLSDGVRLVRQATLGQAIPGGPSPVPFISDVPNEMPKPFSFRDSGLPVPGAVDIWYAMGRFELAPDQALVMTGTLPACEFANVMLWNRHMQTLEYRSRSASLNQAQIATESDGSYRIVISEADPGVANWLDTGRHRSGTIFWRFLLPDDSPDQPRCAVVPVTELTG